MDAGVIADIVKSALERCGDYRIDYVGSVRPDRETGRYDQRSTVSVQTPDGYDFDITVEWID